MTDLDTVRELSARRREPIPCAVVKAMKCLDPKAVAITEQAMAVDPIQEVLEGRKAITNAGIARYINGMLDGEEITWQSVRNHRNHQCGCYADRRKPQ